jgi:hypothetical protein
MIYHNNYRLSIKPLTEDENLRFISMTYVESVGGELPQVTIDMNYSVKSSPDKYVGKSIEFMIQSPISTMKFSGHISSVEFLGKVIIFTLIISDYDFIKDIRSRYLGKSMDSALNRLYSGIMDNRINTDVNNMEIHQSRETDYNCIKRLLRGYAKNCIYGFSSGALIIDKLDKEVNTYNLSRELILADAAADLELSKIKYEEAAPPRLSRSTFRYFNIVAYEKIISYTLKESTVFEDNQSFNIKNLVNPKMTLTRSYLDLIPYKITDKIRLTKNDHNPTNELDFIITNKIIVIDNSGISTKIKLAKYE